MRDQRFHKPPRRVRFTLLALFLFLFFAQVAVAIGSFGFHRLGASGIGLVLLPACGAALGAALGSFARDTDAILIGCIVGFLLASALCLRLVL